MTVSEWISVGGILLTLGSMIALGMRGISQIRQEISDRIADESKARSNAVLQAVEDRKVELEKLRKDWTESQLLQDRNFGEVGLSLRRFIETVEKEMHEAELWGRDHYVQKADFDKAIDRLSSEIKAGNAELKAGLKELKTEVSAR